VVSGIDLIDVNADRCKGQALDLLHGSSLIADQRIHATGYEAIPESDLVCITAGLRRKPDESRLDLINRNVELFLNILGQVEAAGLKKEAILLVVSNPVDVLTYLATTQFGLPWNQVIGLSTQLDSARFRSLIAEALKLPSTQVMATILGEHGDSMVPIWSAAQAAGLPLEKYRGRNSATAEALFVRTRGSGAEVIKLKGGAGFAVGLSIAEVIHSVALDRKRILPVSALVAGTYGIRDVCLSVPTVVGRKGVEAQLEIDLWPKEVSALRHSGQVLRETIDQVLKKNLAAAAKTPVQLSASAAPRPSANGGSVRVTMGSGGGNYAGSSRITISGQRTGGRHGYVARPQARGDSHQPELPRVHPGRRQGRRHGPRPRRAGALARAARGRGPVQDARSVPRADAADHPARLGGHHADVRQHERRPDNPGAPVRRFARHARRPRQRHDRNPPGTRGDRRAAHLAPVPR
jgi:L-lactate dehydrogenase